MRGLRAEPHVVRARPARERDYPILLTPEPVDADGQPLALRYGRPVIDVQLFTAEGTPYPEYVDVRTHRNEIDETWPEYPRILVLPCRATGPDPTVTGERIDGKDVGHGRAVFEVTGGERYIVGAIGGSFGGTLVKERELGRAEQVVAIGPGTHADVELARGTRLEITLVGETRTEDERAVAEGRTHRAGAASLSLERTGMRPEPVYRVEVWTMTSAAGEHRSSLWPLGESDVSLHLPTGSFELVGRMPGGRRARTAVVLRAGATTRATLRF
ncbi:MAG: hypothetical protein GY711_32215 [bacterium]|nr:hypothetical protein [bacterium]